MGRTMCLTQVLHGIRLSHLTFRSEQQMQAKVGSVCGIIGEDAGGFMVMLAATDSILSIFTLGFFATGPICRFSIHDPSNLVVQLNVELVVWRTPDTIF